MYAANPEYKTKKEKLMWDVCILRTYMDGKIPCVEANDAEQLNISIFTKKKKMGVSSDSDESSGTNLTVQTKLQFDSSDAWSITTEIVEEGSDKSFSQICSCKNKKKKS